MEPFIRHEQEGQPVLYFIEKWMNSFPGLTVGFTSRHGGVSVEPFTSMNCGLHVQDADDAVIINRERLANTLQVPFDSLIFAEQVHSNEVITLTQADKGRGITSRENAIQAKDGFVTNEKGIVLCALFADCVPLFFYDPVKRVAGLAHAGWKGTVANIAAATCSLMTTAYGSNPEHIHAAIGPSIGSCCYEVDEVVASRVKALLSEIEMLTDDRKYVLLEQSTRKYQLNLQELNRILLLKAGILSSHIEVTQLCTSCSTDWFFSHRKEGGATGRMSAWISMAK
ncbi:Laccase domain protein [compost metagenome]